MDGLICGWPINFFLQKIFSPRSCTNQTTFWIRFFPRRKLQNPIYSNFCLIKKDFGVENVKFTFSEQMSIQAFTGLQKKAVLDFLLNFLNYKFDQHHTLCQNIFVWV